MRPQIRYCSASDGVSVAFRGEHALKGVGERALKGVGEPVRVWAVREGE